ncbi:MAG: post-transcriptional regulator [Erysipelotrichaceae bacterium]|nr:post-transcriptional regulator [Erysipelotrichaceae bacterium]
MDTYIQMAMVIKLSILRRNSNPNFTYEHIENVMYKEIWKNKKPSLINEAINDIMKLTAEQIVMFLSKQAIIEGKSKRIDEFTDLLGGKENG